MKLTPTMEQFVLHWGEMGSRWGMNRSVAQIHALLYLAPAPMTADEIVEALGVARSNVSTSLKELLSWELVSIVHVLGDRRDHFEAQKDIWLIAKTVIDGRKRREIDPTVAFLHGLSRNLQDDTETPKDVKQRISQLLEFTELLSVWYTQLNKMSPETLLKILKLGSRIASLVKD